MFSCNLPLTCTFGKMTGIILLATAVTRGRNRYRNKTESAQKADPGEENSPAAPAGTRTRDLSFFFFSFFFFGGGVGFCHVLFQFLCSLQQYCDSAYNKLNSLQQKEFIDITKMNYIWREKKEEREGDKHTCTHALTHARAHEHTHTRTHARTRAHPPPPPPHTHTIPN